MKGREGFDLALDNLARIARDRGRIEGRAEATREIVAWLRERAEAGGDDGWGGYHELHSAASAIERGVHLRPGDR